MIGLASEPVAPCVRGQADTLNAAFNALNLARLSFSAASSFSCCLPPACDIDVHLKERHALVPNPIETVKSNAARELGTSDDVIKARGADVGAAAAETQLTGALGRPIALSEAHPDLKANASAPRGNPEGTPLGPALAHDPDPRRAATSRKVASVFAAQSKP